MLDPLIAASAPPANLPGVLHSLEPTLDRFGYLSLGLIFLEDFGIPVPGETVLIIAAIYAGTGRLNIWLVALIGFIAAVLGDNVGFGIGHFGGRPLAERYGKYIFLTPERLNKTAEFFNRHGGKVIVIARFVEGLRQANGIIAGITGMHWTKFLPFNMLGAALWVGVWVSIGYFSGSNIDSIYRTATKYEAYFAIAVGLLIAAWIGWRVWKHRRQRRARRPAHEEVAIVLEAAETPEHVADATGPAAAETPARDDEATEHEAAETPGHLADATGPAAAETPARDEDATEPEAAETPARDDKATGHEAAETPGNVADATRPAAAEKPPPDEDATGPEAAETPARDENATRPQPNAPAPDQHATEG